MEPDTQLPRSDSEYNPLRTRSVEMFLSTVMAAQGAIFIIPGRTLDMPHWEAFRDWVEVFPGSEAGLGFILLFIGIARFMAVIINGHWVTKKHHWYPSPVVRIVGCVVGSLFWMSLTVSFLSAPVLSTPAALGWTLPAIAYETFSAMRAAVDAHIYDSFWLRHYRRERRMRAREEERERNGQERRIGTH